MITYNHVNQVIQRCWMSTTSFMLWVEFFFSCFFSQIIQYSHGKHPWLHIHEQNNDILSGFSIHIKSILSYYNNFPSFFSILYFLGYVFSIHMENILDNHDQIWALSSQHEKAMSTQQLPQVQSPLSDDGSLVDSSGKSTSLISYISLG